MGIPSYFGWIVRYFEKRVIKDKPSFASDGEIHHLYLDFNCAIHPVARSHPENSIEKMCDDVVIYLDYLINYVKPTELVYISIDGVAPCAKMKQQRLRRYKSVKETSDINKIKVQYGVPLSKTGNDFNMISPATNFMSILSDKIDIYIKKIKSQQQLPTIIFSDASIPAEGEHKILQYIKTQPLDKNCVIYGLDSDLIMLSMCAGRDNIVLVREDTFMKNNDVDISVDKFPFLNYFDINELKKILYVVLVTDIDLRKSELAKLNPEIIDQRMLTIQHPINRIIRDYIQMSFLLGNDFVPSFPSLKIRDNGIEKIVHAYRYVITHKTNGNSYLCNDDLTINVDFLSDFIFALARNEEKSLITQKMRRDEQFVPQSSEPKNFQEACDRYQRVDNMSRDTINTLEEGWQDRYYKYWFNVQIGGTHKSQQIDEICREYLIAIQWISLYYFDQCRDWHWFYPHEATPLLTDLLKYINQHKESVNSYVFPQNTPVNPYHQLMMILPPQSVNLIPKPYHKYMLSDDSPLIHYYPTKVDIEIYNKKFRWEAHPKIPIIDPIELIPYVDHVFSLLTAEEQKRVKI